MCKYLVAEKHGKVIFKSPFEPAEFNNGEEEMAKVYIKETYISKEEKEAFRKWYESADWYGYDNEQQAMERLNKRGEFKEEVLPEEFVGFYGDIEVYIAA